MISRTRSRIATSNPSRREPSWPTSLTMLAFAMAYSSCALNLRSRDSGLSPLLTSQENTPSLFLQESGRSHSCRFKDLSAFLTICAIVWLAGRQTRTSSSCSVAVVKSEALKRSRRWPMTTTMRDVDGVTIVDIKGRIVLGEESAAIRALVADLVGKGQRKILLNFVDVNYIDSSGLGNLVSSLVRVRMYDGELKLLNLTKRVHDVMKVTKLNTVFEIMDDEAVAVKSFRQSAGKTG